MSLLILRLVGLWNLQIQSHVMIARLHPYSSVEQRACGKNFASIGVIRGGRYNK